MRPPIHARLLGQVDLAVGERVLIDKDWPRRSARSLLLLLLATPGHALPRERVLDSLWPASTPEAARNALYIALHTLRRVLEPDLVGGRASSYVEVSTETIRIGTSPGCQVDVDAFAAWLTRARSTGQDTRSLLREAVTAYRGDLLADEPYADWPVARREALRQAWQRAVLDLAELDAAVGEPLASVAALDALLASDPTLEDAHRVVIRAYAAAGQLDLARRQYERCVAALREHLDEAPSQPTVALIASLDRLAPAAPVPANRPRFRRPPVPPTPLIGRDDELPAPVTCCGTSRSDW
jgi:DNA-binding SARP family transcriptional activator